MLFGNSPSWGLQNPLGRGKRESERERKLGRRDREREKVSKTGTPKILSQLIWGDTWKVYL